MTFITDPGENGFLNVWYCFWEASSATITSNRCFCCYLPSAGLRISSCLHYSEEKDNLKCWRGSGSHGAHSRRACSPVVSGVCCGAAAAAADGGWGKSRAGSCRWWAEAFHSVFERNLGSVLAWIPAGAGLGLRSWCQHPPRLWREEMQQKTWKEKSSEPNHRENTFQGTAVVWLRWTFYTGRSYCSPFTHMFQVSWTPQSFQPKLP